MTSAVAELPEVVARFYAAALNSDLWTEALDLITLAFNARGAILPAATFVKGALPHSKGMEPVLQQFFEENWHLCDARTIAAQRYVSAHEVVTDQLLFSRAEIDRSRYYDGFARSAGVPWFCAASLAIDRTRNYVALSLQRTEAQGLFDDHDLAKLAQLLPHLRNAAELARKVAHVQAGGILQGLDRAGTPALIVNGWGKVLFSNSCFDRLSHSAIRVSAGRLVASDPGRQSALAGMIEAATQSRLSLGHSPGPLMLPGDEGIAPLVLRASPYHGAMIGAFGVEGALLTLVDLSTTPQTSAAALRAVFDLTPREAQVMALIGHGHDLDRIAGLLQVSRETVRFHLKAILGKTGTHRQSEVAALALRIGPG
ncbi:helix-turn-helix transcriptional regulator [Rhodobacter sp. 24-YEA-8]|uniref:helix-turn-helix transcriptional regulator n=1 Tax=Rhodobacter sp. 24-YEA-8 TaxID=1884310 RepID=UPI00089A1CAF|nr:helix-turn-helix transcriptional regulator [Rhodobacter sp. 24-YEA-8]SED83129.1 DNA-binding transcriptional regulator, CsgD family [Rhodobacter sp. 24-YEA-8]